MLDMHIGCCWFLALLKCFTIGLKVIIGSAMPVVTLCMQWLRTACAIERAAIGWTGRQKRASLAGLLHAPAFLAEHLLAKKKDLGQAALLMEEVLNARQQVLVSSCLAFRPSACCSSAHHLQLMLHTSSAHPNSAAVRHSRQSSMSSGTACNANLSCCDGSRAPSRPHQSTSYPQGANNPCTVGAGSILKEIREWKAVLGLPHPPLPLTDLLQD